MTMKNFPSDHEQDDVSLTLSKTKRKQISHDLQTLGKALTLLPNARLRQLHLPEVLLNALVQQKSITTHGGQRRQLQLIGKLMRDLDENVVAEIKERLNNDAHHTREETAQFHRLERWRLRLLEDDDVLNEWLKHYPQTEVQPMRALIRQARKERELSKPPKAFRELFHQLKLISQKINVQES